MLLMDELTAFVKSVRSEKTYLVNAYTGCDTVEIAEKIEKKNTFKFIILTISHKFHLKIYNLNSQVVQENDLKLIPTSPYHARHVSTVYHNSTVNLWR